MDFRSAKLSGGTNASSRTCALRAPRACGSLPLPLPLPLSLLPDDCKPFAEADEERAEARFNFFWKRRRTVGARRQAAAGRDRPAAATPGDRMKCAWTDATHPPAPGMDRPARTCGRMRREAAFDFERDALFGRCRRLNYLNSGPALATCHLGPMPLRVAVGWPKG